MYVIPDEDVEKPTRIHHPAQYSKNPLTLAKRLHNSDSGPYWPHKQIKPHQMVFHTHIAETGFSEDHWSMCTSVGTMRAHAAYKDRTKTTHPEWSPGFAAIVKGKHKSWTRWHEDWREELGEYITEEIEQALEDKAL